MATKFAAGAKSAKVVLVDDAQDLSLAGVEFILQLSSNCQLIACGDPDTASLGFRAAAGGFVAELRKNRKNLCGGRANQPYQSANGCEWPDGAASSNAYPPPRPFDIDPNPMQNPALMSFHSLTTRYRKLITLQVSFAGSESPKAGIGGKCALWQEPECSSISYPVT